MLAAALVHYWTSGALLALPLLFFAGVPATNKSHSTLPRTSKVSTRVQRASASTERMAKIPSNGAWTADTPKHLSLDHMQSTEDNERNSSSHDAVLWVHLYHDLLLAIMHTPSNPLVAVTDGVIYKNFLHYFKPESTVVDKRKFLQMRKALLPTRLAKIDSALRHRKNLESAQIIDRITLTPDMLEKYKELRGYSESSEEIPNPEQNADLWDFLNVTVRKEYPALYSTLSREQDPGSKDDQNLDHGDKTSTTRTRIMQSAPAQAAHASQHAFHANAPAPSPALRSTSGITLVFKDIFTEEGKANKADNGPRADHKRVQRLPNTERPHRRQQGKGLGQKPPQDAETSNWNAVPLSERPAAELAKTTKRKAPPIAQQNDDVKAKKRAKLRHDGDEVEVKQIKTKWTKYEHKLLFDTINKWCHKNGVDKLEMKVVNKICSDAFKAIGSTRDKSVVASKTKNTEKIVGLIKKAKEMALNVDDFPNELRYPLAALKLNADWNDKNSGGKDNEEMSPVRLKSVA